MQYKDDQYAPSLHVEEFDDSLLYCGTTSLVPKTILPFFVIFENLVTSFAFMTAAAMLVVFPCMDYSSLYFLKNVFTFTTTKINFVSLDLILAIDFFPQNIVIQLVSCFCSVLIRLPCWISLLL